MTYLVQVTCPNCQTVHGIEQHIYDAAKQRNEEMTLHCPNGHPWHYPKGDSQTTILRRERDRLNQRLAMKDDELRAKDQDIEEEREKKNLARRQTRAYKGQVTKIKNRVGKGVCPCCNRQFVNLQRHMDSKHPDYSTEETNLKVVGGTSHD